VTGAVAVPDLSPPTKAGMTTLKVLYRTILATLVTRGRLLALGALGVGAMLVGLAIGMSDPTDPAEAGAEFINGVGLSVLVPVVALVFASASLGDLVEDGTLVYLWLRPIPRWQLAVAAYLAALTATAPLTLVPLIVAASLTGGGADVVVGAAVSSLVGVIAYTGIFCALGLRTQRSLAWGLGYILIWEGFVASAGRGASRVAIRAYTRSILSEAADVPMRLATISPVVAVIVPLVVGAVAVTYVTNRLHRHDIP
jgi:ABC-2 type transport system permease protein